MAEIINLRQARKARRREAASQLAAENRARFGQTRADRARTAAETSRIERTVAGARRIGDPEGAPPDGGAQD